MVYHTSHLYPLRSRTADTLSSDNATYVCQCDSMNYTTIWTECQMFFRRLVLSKRAKFHPKPKGLGNLHFDKSRKEAWPDRNYTMWIRPGVMTFGFTLPGGAQDLQVGSKVVTDNKWHFVAGVYNEKHLTPYVDGEPFNPRGAAGKPATSNAPLIIGAQGPDGRNGPLKGIIDEVAVYNTALDEDELAEVMESLTKQFQAVEAAGKLTVTWGRLKEK